MKSFNTAIKSDDYKLITDYDVMLCISLLDIEILDFTLYERNRFVYSFNEYKNLLLVTNQKYSDSVYWGVRNNIPKYQFDLSNDWFKFQKMANRAKKLYRKYHGKIKMVEILEDRYIINGDTYSKIREYEWDDEKLFDVILGEDRMLIYHNMSAWNVATKNFLTILFNYAKDETKNYLNLFFYENEIPYISFKDYTNIQINSDYKHLGVHIKGSENNFKFFDEMFNYLLSKRKYWNNYDNLINQINTIKKYIIGEQVMKPILDYKSSTDEFKNAIIHLLYKKVDIRNYEYEDVQKGYVIPSKSELLRKGIEVLILNDSYDKDSISYIIRCLSVDDETEEEFIIATFTIKFYDNNYVVSDKFSCDFNVKNINF